MYVIFCEFSWSFARGDLFFKCFSFSKNLKKIATIVLILGKKSMPQILEMITKGKFSFILDMWTITRLKTIYRKLPNSNTSRLETHAGFFRLLMKGIFDPYVLWPFEKNLISKLVTRDYLIIDIRTTHQFALADCCTKVRLSGR